MQIKHVLRNSRGVLFLCCRNARRLPLELQLPDDAAEGVLCSSVGSCSRASSPTFLLS